MVIERELNIKISNLQDITETIVLNNCSSINNISIISNNDTLDDYIVTHFNYKLNDYPFNEFIELNNISLQTLTFNTPYNITLNIKCKKIGIKEFTIHKIIIDYTVVEQIISNPPDLDYEEGLILNKNKYSIYDPNNLPVLNKIKNSLNSVVSDVYGHCVKYWQSLPKKDTNTDVIFKEYTLYNVQPPKNINIIIPDNNLPEDNFEYQLMDMDFMEMPFEIHIYKGEWCRVFGNDTPPGAGDFIYITLLNRIYKVNGIYHTQIKTFDAEGYYRLNLIKWEDEIVNTMSDEVRLEIDDLTKSFDDVFGDKRNEEMKTTTKPNQLTINTINHDEYRSYIDKQLNIIPFDLINNWNVLSNYIYDMSSIPFNSIGVTYKNSINISGFFNVIFWLKTKEGGIDIKQNIISSNNLKIFIQNNQLGYTINNNTYNFNYIFDDSKWYGVNLSISNMYKTSVLNVFENNADKLTKPTNNGLVLIANENVLNSGENALDEKISLIGGQYDITFIRMFDSFINNIDNVMEKSVVQDNKNLIVYDNAIKPLGLTKYKTFS